MNRAIQYRKKHKKGKQISEKAVRLIQLVQTLFGWYPEKVTSNLILKEKIKNWAPVYQEGGFTHFTPLFTGFKNVKILGLILKVHAKIQWLSWYSTLLFENTFSEEQM